jgi:cytochrome d ubiquinol oxidase subunit II
MTGVVLGAFFNGAMFSIDDMHMARWETPYHGLEAALNPYNLMFGLSVFFLVRILAFLYFLNNIDCEQIAIRSKIRLFRNFNSFLALFTTFIVFLMMNYGFNYDPETKLVNMEINKYLNNLLEKPVILAILAVGVLLTLFGIIRSLLRGYFKSGIWYTGTGTILTIMSLLLITGLNHTCFYPSIKTGYLQDSLTIENSSASRYTLTVMSKMSLFIPLVVACMFLAWKTVNRKRVTTDELNKEELYTF